MAGFFEHEWLQKKCDVQRCMKVGKVSDTIIVNLLPHIFLKVERVVGDGGVGTIKLVTLNPAITGGVVKIIKEHVLVFDEAAGVMEWEVLDDPHFRRMMNFMKVTPSEDDPADSRLAWRLEYDPIDPATPPPKEAEVVHLEIMKALMNYVDTHPDWP